MKDEDLVTWMSGIGYEQQVYERLWEKAIREYKAMQKIHAKRPAGAADLGYAFARGAYLSTLEACIACLLLSPAHEEGEDFETLLWDMDRMVKDEIARREETG